MAIRNAAAYQLAQWNWDILKGCFGNSKIMPTDLDAFVEVNNHFLIIEAKGIGVPVPRGQLRSFESLAKSSRFTVVIVNGPPNQPVRMRMLPAEESLPCTIHDLRELVAAWYSRVRAVRFCVRCRRPIPAECRCSLLSDRPR